MALRAGYGIQGQLDGPIADSMDSILETPSVGTPEDVVELLLVPIADAAVLAIFGGQSVLAMPWTCRARPAF